MDFEWDSDKAKKNEAKHGVSFTERSAKIRIISARTMKRREIAAYEQ